MANETKPIAHQTQSAIPRSEDQFSSGPPPEPYPQRPSVHFEEGIASPPQGRPQRSRTRRGTADWQKTNGRARKASDEASAEALLKRLGESAKKLSNVTYSTDPDVAPTADNPGCIEQTIVKVSLKREGRNREYCMDANYIDIPDNVDDQRPTRYVAGRSPVNYPGSSHLVKPATPDLPAATVNLERYVEFGKTVVQAIESGQGLYQFVWPTTHEHDTNQLTISRERTYVENERREKSVYEQLTRAFAHQKKIGKPFFIDHKYCIRHIKKVDDQKLGHGKDYFHYQLSITDRAGNKSTITMTQAGLPLADGRLAEEQIERAHAIYESHRALLRRDQDSNNSVLEPMIMSNKGRIRNATLIAFTSVAKRIDNHSIKNFKDIDDALHDTIFAGYKGRGTRKFIPSQTQIKTLRTALLRRLANRPTVAADDLHNDSESCTTTPANDTTNASIPSADVPRAASSLNPTMTATASEQACNAVSNASIPHAPAPTDAAQQASQDLLERAEPRGATPVEDTHLPRTLPAAPLPAPDTNTGEPVAVVASPTGPADATNHVGDERADGLTDGLTEDRAEQPPPAIPEITPPPETPQNNSATQQKATSDDQNISPLHVVEDVVSEANQPVADSPAEQVRSPKASSSDPQSHAVQLSAGDEHHVADERANGLTDGLTEDRAEQPPPAIPEITPPPETPQNNSATPQKTTSDDQNISPLHVVEDVVSEANQPVAGSPAEQVKIPKASSSDPQSYAVQLTAGDEQSTSNVVINLGKSDEPPGHPAQPKRKQFFENSNSINRPPRKPFALIFKGAIQIFMHAVTGRLTSDNPFHESAFKLRNNRGDGDCLFHALGGTREKPSLPNGAQELRNEIADHLMHKPCTDVDRKSYWLIVAETFRVRNMEGEFKNFLYLSKAEAMLLADDDNDGERGALVNSNVDSQKTLSQAQYAYFLRHSGYYAGDQELQLWLDLKRNKGKTVVVIDGAENEEKIVKFQHRTTHQYIYAKDIQGDVSQAIFNAILPALNDEKASKAAEPQHLAIYRSSDHFQRIVEMPKFKLTPAQLNELYARA